jgi:transcriptional regulator with XRE-family HTH domain
MKHTIGARISTLRKTKGMTQEELAEKVKVSVRALSFWETGKSDPNMSSIKKLASTFGCSAGYLVAGIDERLQRTVARVVKSDSRYEAAIKDMTLSDLLSAIDEVQGRRTSLGIVPPHATPAPDMEPLPVLDKVAANHEIAFASSRESTLVDAKYKADDHYCLQVHGQSMRPTIYENDTVVVRKLFIELSEYDESVGPVDPQPWKELHRKVVVASVDSGEPELKRLFVYPRKDTGFKILLQPDNRSVAPIEISREHRLCIMGVVQVIMRDPLNFE